MDMIELPLVTETETLEAALSCMTQNNISGIVGGKRDNLHLFPIEIVVAGINEGKTTIDELSATVRVPTITPKQVKKYKIDAANPRNTSNAAVHALGALGALYAMAPNQPDEENAVIVTLNETLAYALRVAPQVSFCTGPSRHVYTAATRPADGQCPLDGYALRP